LFVTLFPRIYDLKDLFGRLSLNSDEIRLRGPLSDCRITWHETLAVFCEKRGARRYFVVTSREESIMIPCHIARDLEPMRKLFYNLPQGTLCVNFDKNFRRGYRIRRKGRERAGLRELQTDLM